MLRKKRDHITPMVKQLHWMPVKSRIKFKIRLLTFKALNDLAPQYISLLLTRYETARTLHSSGRGFLQQKVPHLKMTRSSTFSVCAPQIWNSLPKELRQCTSLEVFKSVEKHIISEKHIVKLLLSMLFK